MLVWSTVVYEDATADEEMPPLKGHSTVNPETLGNGQVHEHQNGDVEVSLISTHLRLAYAQMSVLLKAPFFRSFAYMLQPKRSLASPTY